MTGQKEKALVMVNWLADHESKTGLAPVIKNPKQASTGQPALRCHSDPYWKFAGLLWFARLAVGWK
ncbi:MAG: hypothetical protein EOP84_18450 [Verrucomicrobiaceae bacterium]|nr:MAG: hypothetical protein EOP84_18450 [Verrucomicrobiaceae bacterium]